MSRPAERPILFSDAMVLAILERRKFQTRRVCSPQPEHGAFPCHFSPSGWAHRFAPELPNDDGCTCRPLACPYDAEALWLREAWRVEDAAEAELRYRADAAVLRYLDGGDAAWWKQWRAHSFRKSGRPGWCPGIYLPRWASRITLHGVTVRVERLNAISEADARAEGVTLPNCSYPYVGPGGRERANAGMCQHGSCPRHGALEPHRMAFAALWDSINAERGFPWSSNVWVWVVGWERAEVRT